jgi:hypothetical protein
MLNKNGTFMHVTIQAKLYDHERKKAIIYPSCWGNYYVWPYCKYKLCILHDYTYSAVVSQ